jgi:hypothetical protein
LLLLLLLRHFLAKVLATFRLLLEALVGKRLEHTGEAVICGVQSGHSVVPEIGLKAQVLSRGCFIDARADCVVYHGFDAVCEVVEGSTDLEIDVFG